MTTYRRKNDRRLVPSSTAKKVAKVQSDVSVIKRLVYNEQKYYDQFNSYTILNAGTQFISCNNLAQGDGASQRTGNGVANKSLTIRINASHNPAGADYMNLRVMLVKDKQPNGAFPVGGTLLQNVSFQSGLNDSQLLRFKVLADRTLPLSISGPMTSNIVIRKKLKDFTRYSGNVNSIADIQTNAYWLFLISDQAASGPIFTYNIRYKFSDM